MPSIISCCDVSSNVECVQALLRGREELVQKKTQVALGLFLYGSLSFLA